MRILIAGTGIAGTAAALYLHRDGHDLTMIDKAPLFRNVGYGLALKSFGLRVMDDLGLLGSLQQRAISMETINILESNGTLIKAYAAELMANAAQGATMVYRSDLHQVLYSALCQIGSVRFSTQLANVVQDDAGVQVTYSSGSLDRFDVVVLAEGLRSTSRKLLWGDQGFTPFDVIYAAASVEHRAADAGTLLWYLGPGASFAVIPVGNERALIQVYCRGTFAQTGSHDDAARVLRKHFQGFDKTVLTLIDQLSDADEIFYDNVAMITLPHLSKGRVVLLGDAGYCPTFLSGMGASLGLIGAKALEQSLRAFDADAPSGLDRYNTLMQPLIRHFQRNAADHVHTLLTVSPTKEWIRDRIMHALPQAWLARAGGRQYAAESTLVHRILSP